MKMRDLRDLKDLDRDDILGLLGLKSKRSYLAGMFTTFGVGLLVGGGVALLLAWKPGKELRRDLSQGLARANDQVGARAASAAEEIVHKGF